MFSFIIPCFNGKEALRNCLESFVWQDQSIDFEVILIDNNSTRDNLDELYNAYVDKFSLYLLKQPKLISTYVLCKARNLGISIAQYKWIVTLDSDIILNPNYIQSLHTYLKDKSNVMLCGKRIFTLRKDVEPLSIDTLQNAPEIASSSNYNQIEDRRLPYLKKIESVDHPWAFFHGCNTIFEKENALQIGGCDEAYDGNWGYEDIDFAYRIMKNMNIKPIYHEDLYVYHQEEEIGGVLNRFNKSKNPNWKRICNTIPGFKEFKTKQYQSLNPNIVLDV